MSEPLLAVRGLTVEFGGVRALDDAEMEVQPGSVHGLVGPNGSGKTTLINCVSGFVRPSGGEVWFQGRDITHSSAASRARAGLGRTFQHPMTFGEQDALTNVRTGAHTVDRVSWVRSIVAPRRSSSDGVRTASAVLDQVGVRPDGRPVSTFSYGNQRRVDVARAVVRRPTLVLLDEPAAGLAGSEIDRLTAYVRTLTDAGATVLITDHNMDFMMGICHVLTVLNFGEVIAEGSPLQIRNDPSVLKAYLGDGRTNRAAERPSTRTMVGPTPGSAAQPTLAVRDLVAGYAAGSVLHSVSFDAVAGEVRALVGANGAGKSTAMLTVSGVVRRTSGTISLGGERIDGSSPAAIVRRGVAHVPEGRRVLSGLSVDDNLAMGAYTVKDRRSVRGQLDRVFELLPVLAQRRRQLAGSMSGGEQQMLAIARALMCQPTVLLLDEPTMGLSPLMADRVLELVRSLADGGLAVILVEQNATAALDVSDRAYVMRMGRIVAEGSASDLMAQDTIRNAYLGSD